ncbi:hypothetical protein [Streptomyces galilaeus]|uniref:hypothetical protein n=1 Tax=Streptomyces galilaeus TaxID=33899 RepID=UPI0038F75E79
MAHAIPPLPPAPALRPDLSLAQDCRHCHEWGTVVTPDGHHALCPACQDSTRSDIAPQSADIAVDRTSAHP